MDLFRAQIRAVLRGRGFDFCDEEDSSPIDYSAEEQRSARGISEASRYESLVSIGVAASNTDDDAQSIGNTLLDDDSFWSSTGRPLAQGTDTLTYRLADPLCAVRSVTLSLYRARYQFGDPVYPPLQISFQMGPSLQALHNVGHPQEVLPAEFPQTFWLPPHVPASGFLRLVLHGRRQRQLEDLQFYMAIRHVAAHGQRLPPSTVAALPHLLRSAKMQLPGSSYLPASAVLPSANRQQQRQAALATHAAAQRVFLDDLQAGRQPGQPNPLRARLAAFLGFFGAENAAPVEVQQWDAEEAGERSAAEAAAAAAAAAGGSLSPSAAEGEAAAARVAEPILGSHLAAAAQAGPEPMFVWHDPPPVSDTASECDSEGMYSASWVADEQQQQASEMSLQPQQRPSHEELRASKKESMPNAAAAPQQQRLQQKQPTFEAFEPDWQSSDSEMD